MRDDKPIERIARPRFLGCVFEPLQGRRLIDRPAVALDDPAQTPPQTQPANFVQQLQFEQRRGGDEQPRPGSGEPADATMILVEPDDGIRVEQDHGRRRVRS